MIRLCLQPELGFGNLHMVACIRVTSSFRLVPSDGAVVPWAPSPWSPSACVSDVVSFQSRLRSVTLAQKCTPAPPSLLLIIHLWHAPPVFAACGRAAHLRADR